MSDRKRIEDLEKRVKELETRPAMPMVIVLPAPAAAPVYTHPYIPWGQPWIVYDGTSLAALGPQPGATYISS
jgi:hypothetical protein